MNLKGSTILITGANRGIGQATAYEAARRGAPIVLANRTSDPDLQKKLLLAGSPRVDFFQVDLSRRENIDEFLLKIKDIKIDILFNNAGLLTGGLLEEQPINEIYDMLQINVSAVIHLTHSLLPQMLKRNSGKIINHSSVSGIMNIPCASTYSAAKSAVLAFNNCLRQELVGTGVSTLALITPGIETRMYKDIPNKYGKNLNVSSFLKSITPENYAKQICDAIESDQEYLWPKGATRISLLLAQHAPRLFEYLMRKNFYRSPSL